MNPTRRVFIRFFLSALRYKEVTQDAPLSMRYIRRASFIETLAGPAGTFVFQWDISKVSDATATKKQAAENACTYHVEFELKSKITPIQDKALEAEHDRILVRLVIARIRKLCGSHYIEDGTHKPLEPARLTLLNAPNV